MVIMITAMIVKMIMVIMIIITISSSDLVC
jgi:hypothetical protein